MTCLCGKQAAEGQQFCFQCWLEIPASIAYRLLDSRSGPRAVAVIDAEAYLKPKHVFIPIQPDRKTLSAGE